MLQLQLQLTHIPCVRSCHMQLTPTLTHSSCLQAAGCTSRLTASRPQRSLSPQAPACSPVKSSYRWDPFLQLLASWTILQLLPWFCCFVMGRCLHLLLILFLHHALADTCYAELTLNISGS